MYELLLERIKEKKPLDRLDDSIVLDRINKFLDKNKKLLKKIDFKNGRNANFKLVMKNVRDELNKRYGQFWSNKISLEGHKSSMERLNFYTDLYKKIFKITGKPGSILDISSGLNPLSISLMNFNGKYICTEINSRDCDLLNEWFKKNKINGKAIQIDITKTFDFPKAELVFLFKVFDSVEENGHKLAENILKNLKCKYAIVSFATIAINGKKMNFPSRGWIERLLDRLNLKYNKIEFSNEIFYIISFQ